MFPSSQVIGVHDEITSFPVVKELMLKFSVITESQPAADPPTMVNVAVLLLALYVLPSIQVIGVQLEMLFVELVKELMLKFSVITESQPAADPPAMVNVAVLLLAL